MENENFISNTHDESTGRWKIFLYVFIALGILIYAFKSCGEMESVSSIPVFSEYEAIHQAKTHVKSLLKSPSTAKFGDYKATIITDNKINIVSYVDSQNGFGAMIRTYFQCDVVKVYGTNFRIENLIME